MSSRLFQEIREKRGLCYSIGTDSSSYREAGLFVVYADTSADQLVEVEDLTRKELRSLAEEGVSADELERAKQQIRSATLLSLDDVGSRMSRLARSLLYHDRIIPLAEIVAEVEALTPEDIRSAAHRLFGRGEYAFAAIGPFKKRRTRAS
jgi:predicted Zn-dependent peptidase